MQTERVLEDGGLSLLEAECADIGPYWQQMIAVNGG
jgi:hypothetical protein